MGNELLTYIKGILCYVLFSSLLIQMFPKTKDKKYLQLTIGLIFLYLIMKPVLSFLSNYDEILSSEYFSVDFDSDFLLEQKEEFDTQTGVVLMNHLEKQMELMGYENAGLVMKKSGTEWILYVEVKENLSQDWEGEKKNLKNIISNFYNLDEDNINIEIHKGGFTAILGHNGSGKSTICKVLMGDKNYEVVSGTITFKDKDLLSLDTVERARMGLYLVSQNPIEVEGVKNSEMLKLALEQRTGKNINIFEFSKIMNNVCEKLNIDKSFIHRGINESMSGGERKKNELMHLYVLEPDFIILDEIDSGVDIDNLNNISLALKEYYETHDCSIMIITHHTNILKNINTKFVHVLSDGKIVESGDYSLASSIENEGFNRTNKVSENINNE